MTGTSAPMTPAFLAAEYVDWSAMEISEIQDWRDVARLYVQSTPTDQLTSLAATLDRRGIQYALARGWITVHDDVIVPGDLEPGTRLSHGVHAGLHPLFDRTVDEMYGEYASARGVDSLYLAWTIWYGPKEPDRKREQDRQGHWRLTAAFGAMRHRWVDFDSDRHEFVEGTVNPFARYVLDPAHIHQLFPIPPEATRELTRARNVRAAWVAGVLFAWLAAVLFAFVSWVIPFADRWGVLVYAMFMVVALAGVWNVVRQGQRMDANPYLHRWRWRDRCQQGAET